MGEPSDVSTSNDSTIVGSDILQFFKFDHLPPNLQFVSKSFATLAYSLAQFLPPNQEREVALRKLLEAKDCAVRAAIFKKDW